MHIGKMTGLLKCPSVSDGYTCHLIVENVRLDSPGSTERALEHGLQSPFTGAPQLHDRLLSHGADASVANP